MSYGFRIREIRKSGENDFSKWPTAKHFTSWLCLAPNPQITGGKTIRHKVNRTSQRANQALRRAANSLHNSKGALGAQFRKLKARKGPKVAVKAMARKIAVIIYHMVREQKPFERSSAQQYETQYEKRRFKKIAKEAKKMGYTLQASG